MGDTTAHGLPYPVGTDRVMDGDNAMQALAEAVDSALWAGDATTAPGVWQQFAGAAICTATSLAAVAGSFIDYARWMKIGNTVWFQGQGQTANAITDPAIVLPNSVGGVPHHRALACGVFIIVDSADQADPSQTSIAIMSAGKDRLIAIRDTGGYVDAPATSALRWNVVYETLT